MDYADKLGTVAKALEKRGFTVVTCKTGKDAAEYVMAEAADAKSVGFGGSVTIGAIGLRDMMAEAGKEILRHGDPKWSPGEKLEIMRRELASDLFLLSANAITIDGRIVNIDGNGNRVAASIFGPAKVIFVAGRNKIVDGGIDEAIARIKAEACPKNCIRLAKKTPCAVTGQCIDCDSPDRICKVTVVLERRPSQTPTHVVLVDEDLGF